MINYFSFSWYFLLPVLKNSQTSIQNNIEEDLKKLYQGELSPDLSQQLPESSTLRL